MSLPSLESQVFNPIQGSCVVMGFLDVAYEGIYIPQILSAPSSYPAAGPSSMLWIDGQVNGEV